MGTKFTVYDHGVSPAKAQGLVEKAYMRQELAAVCYVQRGSPGSRPALHGLAASPRGQPRVQFQPRIQRKPGASGKGESAEQSHQHQHLSHHPQNCFSGFISFPALVMCSPNLNTDACPRPLGSGWSVACSLSKRTEGFYDSDS